MPALPLASDSSAQQANFRFGFAAGCEALPLVGEAVNFKQSDRGHSPSIFLVAAGGAEPPPHIRWRSRCQVDHHFDELERPAEVPAQVLLPG